MSSTDVAAWHPAPFHPALLRLAVVEALLTGAIDALRSAAASRAGWTGPAAELARAHEAELAARLDAVVEIVRLLQRAVARTAEQLAVVVRMVEVHQLSRLAGGSGLDDLLDPASRRMSVAATAAAQQADRDLGRAFGDAITRLHSGTAPTAGSATTVLALATPAARAERSAARASSVESIAVPPSTASGVAGWWATLTVEQQQEAVGRWPEAVGPTDGLPAWARDRANRVLLDRAEADLAAQVVVLQPGPPTWGDLLEPTGLAGAATIGTFGGGTRRVAYQQAVAKLSAVRATRQVLDQPDGQRRQLLSVDVSGRSAHVAVAVGDLDHAHHVAVVVPGFTTTVERDLVGADRVSADLADEARRAASLVGDDRAVAAVTWIGYDIPQTSDTLHSGHSVVLRRSAQAGAVPLAAFLGGIAPGRHVTLVGHSYGSTTAGLAVARGGTGVEDLVALGSPGLGTSAVAEFGLPPSRVHVLEADEDPVADLGWFGPDPSGLPGVDRLSTEDATLPDGSGGIRSTGHSAYLARGTTSQWNVAAVVAGAPSVRPGRLPASW
jgi:hypothetical protein